MDPRSITSLQGHSTSQRPTRTITVVQTVVITVGSHNVSLVDVSTAEQETPGAKGSKGAIKSTFLTSVSVHLACRGLPWYLKTNYATLLAGDLYIPRSQLWCDAEGTSFHI